MSRQPSAETRLRHLTREIKRLEKTLSESNVAAQSYRARLTKAEQAVAEWKARCDALIAALGRNVEAKGDE